jgi:hypothetical protein
MADGQVVFEITADGKHAIASVKDITAAIQSESKKWDRAAGEATDNIEDSFLSMAKKVAAGLSAAKIGKALLDIGKDAINAASDLAEVQNVVDVTFGDGAKQIESWAKTAGRQFGLTETQAKKFTSTIGAMMKSAGMSGDEIVEMSTDLAGLAADMASFYNLDFETAFQKIRSGISGETEPLKQLGVNMSVANLEAFALEKGITKAFNAMSQSEQTMLRYQYLMQATADAQGDFSRTADGFANATRRVETALDTIRTKGGGLLMTIIEPITTGLAGLLESVTAQPEETLFDRINNIQVETDQKIADIGKVAAEAEALIEKLNLITGTSAGEALSKMAVGANKLNANAPETWTALFGSLANVDGLQNVFGSNSVAGKNIEDLANALSSAEVNTDKAEAWKTFLGALSDNADAVANLTGKSVEETAAWLNSLSEAVNSIDASDAEAWNSLLTTLVAGFSADTPEGAKFIQSLAEQFLAMGSDSDVAAQGLAALGYTSEQIADKQSEWLKVCKDLVKTIPGLSSVINTETGEVKGGIGALEDYVKEWKASQEKLLYWKAYYAKKAAQQEAENQLYSLEIEAGGLRIGARKAREEFEKEFSDVSQGQKDSWFGDLAMDRPLSGRAKEYTDAWLAVTDAEAKATEAENKYNTAVEQNSEIIKQNENEKQYLIETVGELTEEEIKAGEAGQQSGEDTSDAWKKSIVTVQEAIKAMADYAQSVHDATAQAVNSVISGFESVHKAGDEFRTKSNELAAQETEALNKYTNVWQKWGSDNTALRKMKEYVDAGGKLTDAEKQAYEALVNVRNAQNELNQSMEKYKPETMAAGLQSQIDYMQEYLDNLEKARELGYSNDLLASLSDGSAESAEYLNSLVNSGQSKQDIEKLNKLYADVQSKKEEFTTGLTEQKLAVDETYQAMVDKAKEAVGELFLGEEASSAMADLVGGLASGLSENESQVAAAVQAIIDDLNRLNTFGVSVNLGSFGSINLNLNTLNGSHATGLDYVPFNGYLAELHEGEGILTAEENRIWQRFKNGGSASQNVDYSALGDVMRDNVKPGGDVYLDGRVVGSVISKQQANSYRSLQRSGWQQ